MSRRFGRRNARGGGGGGGGGGASTPDQRINALLPYSFFDFDASSTTISGGKVTSVADKVATGTGIRAITAAHAFTQADAAKQVVTPVAESKVGGAMAGIFNAVENYASNSPASSWRCAHAGTGFTSYFVGWSSNVGVIAYHFGTRTAGVGALAGHLTVADAQWYISNGAFIVNNNLPASLTVNTPYVHKLMYGESDTPNKAHHRVSLQTQLDFDPTGAPSAADPGSTMIVGGRATAANMWSGGIACEVWFNRVLTAAHDTEMRAALAAKYGVT